VGHVEPNRPLVVNAPIIPGSRGKVEKKSLGKILREKTSRSLSKCSELASEHDRVDPAKRKELTRDFAPKEELRKGKKRAFQPRKKDERSHPGLGSRGLRRDAGEEHRMPMACFRVKRNSRLAPDLMLESRLDGVRSAPSKPRSVEPARRRMSSR